MLKLRLKSYRESCNNIVLQVKLCRLGAYLFICNRVNKCMHNSIMYDNKINTFHIRYNHFNLY